MEVLSKYTSKGLLLANKNQDIIFQFINKKKNIKNFFGKPIIAYSIEKALLSDLFGKVIVSTDDDEINSIAKQFGAEVPFKRPTQLSDDYTGTTPVVSHAVKWLKNQGKTFNAVCCIYPTAPLLDLKYVERKK